MSVNKKLNSLEHTNIVKDLNHKKLLHVLHKQFRDIDQQKLKEEQENVDQSKAREPPREPQIPEEWLQKDNKKRINQRKQRIKKKMQEKKDEMKKLEQKKISEMAWQLWVQKKEQERLERMLNQELTDTEPNKSIDFYRNYGKDSFSLSKSSPSRSMMTPQKIPQAISRP